VAGVRVDRDVMIPMRDGVHLACDVYRPDHGRPCPVLYAVSCYQKDLAGLPAVAAYPWRETGPIEWYVAHDYVYALADARGTGRSVEGRWAYMDQAEQTDLYDAVEWLAAQPWSTGRVGMIGQSYYGMVQWHAAVQAPPHLACIAPYDAHVDHYRDGDYHGGIPAHGLATIWSFQVRHNHVYGPPGPEAARRLSTDLVEALLQRPTDDDWWRSRAPFWRLGAVTVPTFSIGSWGKNSLHLRGNLIGYEQVRGPRKLLVEGAAGPVRLGVVKAQEEFEDPAFHERVLLPWYEHWLKGVENGVMDGPPVRLWVSGADEYRDESEWPPAGVEWERWHLRRGPAGAVRSLNDGLLAPSPPAPGEGSVWYAYPDPLWHLGPVVVRPDGSTDATSRVLTWTSPPLERELEVIGPISLVLYAASDQPDTDFFVKLWDQWPGDVDGEPRARLLTRGWLRASHRALDEERSRPWRPFHPHRDPRPIEPGAVYRLDIEIWPIAHVFGRGHRMRLHLTNGDSSVTDGNYTHFYGLKCGRDTIFHDAERPSHLLLPVRRG
jgi:predicted acyl esterase